MDCIDHGLAGDKDGYGSTCKHEYRGLRNKSYKGQVDNASI